MFHGYGGYNTGVLSVQRFRAPPWVLSVGLVAAAGVGAARAQPIPAVTPDPIAGRTEFRVAAQAFRAKRFDVAARAFEQAYGHDPRPETAFSLAQANRLQYYFDKVPWRVQRAVQMYEAYLAGLPSGPRAQEAIDRVGELTAVLRTLRERGELVPYVPPVRTQVVVGAEVERADITIDGRAAALWDPVDVAPGAHEIVVTAPGYEPERRRIRITEGTFLPVDVPLRPKPGRIRMRADAGATLYIDGRRLGELDGDGERPALVSPGAHFVSVTRRGREAWSRRIVVPRDGRVDVVADLQSTAQRRVSRWVLASAATVAVGAGGVGLWAYAARRDAEAIDEARLNLTATPADLARYNELVDSERSRTRLAVGLSISAAAFAVLGVGMYLFDHPAPDTSPRAEVQPVFADDTIGLAVSGAF